MTLPKRTAVLRADAVFLLVASLGGLAIDLAAAFFQRGPERAVIAAVPDAAIGFVEAHGLAFIFGILLWRARPERQWHLTAAGVHLLLGTANLVFWQIFITADMLATGYLATSLHGLFVVGQLAAARASGHREASSPMHKAALSG